MSEGPVNRIYLGDNLPIMRRHIDDESVDLIYLDPPFNSQATYRLSGSSTGEGQHLAFEDSWTWDGESETAYRTITGCRSTNLAHLATALRQILGPTEGMAYLVMMIVRLMDIHRILKPTGSLYLHCDPTASHYLKLILDAIFGPENFQREIVWRIGWVSGYKTQAKNWIRNHDIILYYTRSGEFTFNKEYIPYPPGYTRRDGSRPTGKGIPLEDTWNCHRGDPLHSIMIMSYSAEKTGYPTQKPVGVLRRIISASSNPGDLVLDFFAGSGTVGEVCLELERNFVLVDNNPQAINVMKARFERHESIQWVEMIGE